MDEIILSGSHGTQGPVSRQTKGGRRSNVGSLYSPAEDWREERVVTRRATTFASPADFDVEVETEVVEDGEPSTDYASDTLESGTEESSEATVSTDTHQHRWFGGLEDDDRDVC